MDINNGLCYQNVAGRYKIKNKTLYLVLSLVFPILLLIIVSNLYNLWFDTYDKIKYEPNTQKKLDKD